MERCVALRWVKLSPDNHWASFPITEFSSKSGPIEHRNSCYQHMQKMKLKCNEK